MDDGSLSHAERVAGEVAFFETFDLQALPEIYHYWSLKHLHPELISVFGTTDLWGIFAGEIRASIERTGNPMILSIGSGDGEIELIIAERLIAGGCTNFLFQCLELSPALIARGKIRASEKNLSRYIQFVETDLTDWEAKIRYGAVFANHSLHHIVALEHVFDQIHTSLSDGGSFVVGDMIGRNGHMRWPEVEAFLQLIWQVIPDRYRYNHQLKRHEAEFVNWDCSTIGFEGIRAQDIMPELLKRFSFEKYCAWGGLTDIFIDRCFGYNLSPNSPEDAAFIDHLAAANRKLLTLGTTTPTQIIAVMRKGDAKLISNGLDPTKAVHA